MPLKLYKPCSALHCPEVVPVTQSRCDKHRAEAEKRRGTPAQRGYGKRHRSKFREAVLARNPICVLCHRRPSTDADHYPYDRRQLEMIGADPDDPKHGRGLCHACHSAETAKHQPGGWNSAQ